MHGPGSGTLIVERMMRRMRVMLVVLGAAGVAIVSLGSWCGWWGRSVHGSADDVRTGERALRADGVGWTDRKPNDVEDLVTAEGVRVVREAERVEFFKLTVDPYTERGIEWTLDRRRDGNAGDLQTARDVLLSPEIYSWDRRGGHKRCGGFQPRDAVRFWKRRNRFCF